MGNTPNRGFTYPEDTDKVGQGDDAIRTLATQVDTALGVVLPIAGGGTGANAKLPAKTNLGITYGTANPAGGSEGDIYFKLV
jgi:hypothetical protein